MRNPYIEDLEEFVSTLRGDQEEAWNAFEQRRDEVLKQVEEHRDQLWSRWDQHKDQVWNQLEENKDEWFKQIEENKDRLWSLWEENKDQLWSRLQEHKEELFKQIDEHRNEWGGTKPDSEPDPDPDPDPDPYEGFSGLNGWEIGFVEGLNDFRERLGVQKLAFDQFLIEESEAHSEAMADAIARGVSEDQAITSRSFVNPDVGVTSPDGLYGDYSDRPDITLGPWYLDIWVDRYIAETPQASDSSAQGAGYLDYAFTVPEFRKAVFDPFYDKIGVGFAYYDDGDPNTFDGYLTILVGTDDTALNL